MTLLAVAFGAWWAAALLADEPPPPGSLVWTTPSASRSAGVAPDAAGAGADAVPVPIVTPRIVAWSTGRAIHAVRLEDGRPLWRDDGAPPSTEIVSLPLLMPAAGAGGASAEATISRPFHQAGRLFAAVLVPPRSGGGGQAGASGSRGLLFAVDCSDAAQGRVEWAVEPPPGTIAFDGPPWVDGERIHVIVRGAGPRMPRMLATFDVLDGRHLDTRLAAEAEGPPATAGHRVAAGAGRWVVASERTIECRDGLDVDE